MSSKRKKRVKSKIAPGEIRTPINLQQLVTKNRVVSIPKSEDSNPIPFIQHRGNTPSNSLSKEKSALVSQSLSKFPSVSDNLQYFDSYPNSKNPYFTSSQVFPNSKSKTDNFSHKKNRKTPLSIENDISISLTSDMGIGKKISDEGEDQEYQVFDQEIFKRQESIEEKALTGGGFKQVLAEKYKFKYKKKLKETIDKQNEAYKIQIESLKRHYESKIQAYKDIIQKLQNENEKLAKCKPSVKHPELLDPLIEENLWLKSQLALFKSSKTQNTRYN